MLEIFRTPATSSATATLYPIPCRPTQGRMLLGENPKTFY
jgi:hypothetical protein